MAAFIWGFLSVETTTPCGQLGSYANRTLGDFQDWYQVLNWETLISNCILLNQIWNTNCGKCWWGGRQLEKLFLSGCHQNSALDKLQKIWCVNIDLFFNTMVFWIVDRQTSWKVSASVTEWNLLIIRKYRIVADLTEGRMLNSAWCCPESKAITS